MSVIKKFLFVLCILNSLALVADEKDDSGRVNVVNIMSNEETGIAAYNKKNIHYAESLNLEKDLNISEVAKKFPCKTEIGMAFLAETLKTPVAPEDRDSVLVARQRAIKALVKNPSLKKEVEALLEDAKNEETQVIELMSEFFKGKTCPELKALESIKKQSVLNYKIFRFLKINPIGRNVNFISNAASIPSMLGSMYFSKKAYRMSKFGGSDGVAFGFAVNLGIVGIFGSYDLYKDYMYALDKRSKIHALNRLIVIAEAVEGLCGTYAIKSQFKISDIHEDGQRLIQKLHHRRYRKNRSFFFYPPAVHNFLYELYELQTYLSHVFASIAELDAYNAIATKILESQNTRNKFCFVNFVDSEKPVVCAKTFWNVLVENAVPSSISEDRQMILTGPNAGGKTTAIRALLQNVVLAQTFGIAAAESFECTMFDVIHSYLNISDDLLNGLSLFASEVKRAQEILQSIKSLGPDKKYFFALDELFTGTSAEDGEKCAYEFVKRLASFDRVQFLYATHFDKLKELGDSSARCENYKVDAPTKDENGKFVYPYTLSLGASNVKIGLEIAQQANLFG